MDNLAGAVKHDACHHAPFLEGSDEAYLVGETTLQKTYLVDGMYRLEPVAMLQIAGKDRPEGLKVVCPCCREALLSGFLEATGAQRSPFLDIAEGERR